MILRNSAILAFFSILSLLLGVLRDRLLATIVGVGPVLDVYNAAFRIPDLVYGILLSFVSAAIVVPFITSEVHASDHDGLEKKMNSLLFFFAGTQIVLLSLMAIVLPYVTQYIVPGFDASQTTLYVTATRLLLIQPLLLGISMLISCIAQVKHKFVLYSVAPLLYTACIIISIPFLYPTYGLLGIIGGVVIGAIIHFTVQSYTWITSGMVLNSSKFSWSIVREHLHFAIPRSGSHITGQVRNLIFATVATSMGVGVLSIYVFAQRIIDAFIQVLVQSVSSASVPILAKHHAHNEEKEYSTVLLKVIGGIVGLSFVMQIASLLFGNFIVTTLYGHSAFRGDIEHLFILLVWSLPLYAINSYLANAFSGRDTRSLFYANFMATLFTIAVLYLTAKEGIVAFAYATWTLGISYLLLILYFYSRKRRLSSAS